MTRIAGGGTRFDDLDAQGLLARAQERVVERRAGELSDLRLTHPLSSLAAVGLVDAALAPVVPPCPRAGCSAWPRPRSSKPTPRPTPSRSRPSCAVASWGFSRTDAHGLRTICARSHHRSKTHLPYFVWIIDSTTKLWKTPHGLWRIVDHHGTHHPEIIELHPDLTVA